MYSSTIDNESEKYIKIAHLSIAKNHIRALLPCLFGLLYLLDSGFRTTLLSTMADAYINVGVFVAVTLFIYYGAERVFGFDISKIKDRPAWQQITIASFLGALPGCGGAIIVVSQYAAGHMSFAAFVAVLVATMGDAAFLILAKDLQIGLTIVALGFAVGILSGLVVNALHSQDFLRQPITEDTDGNCVKSFQPIPKTHSLIWMLLLIIAFPFTMMSAFQVEVNPITIYAIEGMSIDIEMPFLIGAMAAILGLLMWALLPLKMSYRSLVAEDGVAEDGINESFINKNFANKSCANKNIVNNNLLQRAENENEMKKEETSSDNNVSVFKPQSISAIIARVIHDTNFIMVWVMLAFLLFELFMYYTGFSLEGLFTQENAYLLWLAPLIGVVVGFLPGCGPQIIVATLYLQGVVPVSTLLGNAISNDGDALFPALALAPKAAILATVYSAIPAIIVAYTVHVFWVL